MHSSILKLPLLRSYFKCDVSPHLNQSIVIVKISNTCLKTSDLTRVIETCKHLYRNKYSYWCFLSCIRHFLQLVKHAPVYGSYTCVILASHMPVLAISSYFCALLLSM